MHPGRLESLFFEDCQAVVSLRNKSNEQRLSYKVKMAGFAAQANFDMIKDIIKVKSHCSKEQAKGLGQEQHHRGNELADSMALRARPTHEEDEINEYVCKQRTRHTNLLRIVGHLAKAKKGVVLPERPKKDTQTARRRRKPTRTTDLHKWNWSQSHGCWVCSVCNRRTHDRNQAKACRGTVGKTEALHHHTQRVFKFERVDEAGWINARVICGYYAQFRAINLMAECPKRPANTTLLSRLKSLKHVANRGSSSGSRHPYHGHSQTDQAAWQQQPRQPR